MNVQIDKIQLRKNVSRIYFFSFFWMFMVIIPVLVPYWESFNLTMHDVFLLQSLFGAVVALLEVPSGYLADIWGRKKTILFGTFMSGCAYTFLLFANDFWSFLVFEILVGIALSMISGSDLAILYDSIDLSGGDRREKTNAIANIQFARVSSESLGAMIGGLLALWSFRHVIWVQSVVGWAGFFIALTIKEPPIDRFNQSTHWDNVKTILRHIFKGDRILKLSFFTFIVWSLATYIAVWIFQKYWMDENISLGFFGFLWAGYAFSCGIVGKQAARMEAVWGVTSVLVMIALAPVVGYFGMALTGGWLGVTLGLSFQVCRGLTQVIIKDALNARTPNHFRATMNSLAGLFFRGSFFLVGPLVGFSIDRNGVTPTLYFLGAVYVIFALILMIPLIRAVGKDMPTQG